MAVGHAFTTTFGAIFQLVLIGLVGFLLVRRKTVSESGLNMIGGLVINVFLPLLMFTEIIRRFDVRSFPDWWVFPLLSLAVTGAGLLAGYIVLRADDHIAHPREFLSLTAFQNSGYLPLPLVAALLPRPQADIMFIYIFLFLLAFNMTIFSVGYFLLNPAADRRFDPRTMFNPPVIATLAALLVAFARAGRFFPEVVVEPAAVLGRCAIPLSILVVGGNLALMRVERSAARPLTYALLIKLVILPLFFLSLVVFLRIPAMMGFLLVLQAAMPPAVLLSVVCRSQDCGDKLVSPAIFYGHALSIVTVPLVLALFRVFSRVLY
ncbi:MAG: AEC family transporter [Deltaproteobacteria bacterium]